MPVPPEVLFHRYFQHELSRPDRQAYRGKADLYRLNHGEMQLLADIQDMLNGALANERAGDPLRSPDDRFHFDYIDSDLENAMAFFHEGYSFIGVTIGLVRNLLAICGRLGGSMEVISALGLRAPDLERDLLTATSTRLQLFFVVVHEYTHHIHGHVPRRGSGRTELDEYGPEAGTGMEQQTLEVDADGFAVYLVLTNLIAGADRPNAIAALGIGATSPELQDRVLLATFVTALCAHFLSRSPRVVDASTAYSLTHPPPAARMRFVLEHALLWSDQYRPHLREWMTPREFQPLMRAAANALWGPNGDASWLAQVAFLTSDAGRKYVETLDRAIDGYKSKS